MSYVVLELRIKIFRGYFIGNFNENLNTPESESGSVISDSL